MKINKPLFITLIILNIVVLAGQLWPAGSPRFARVVNIIFLFSSLLFFITAPKRK